MKIGIFLHPYGEKEPAGLAHAILELAQSLIIAAPQDEFLIYIKGNEIPDLPFAGTNWTVHALGGGWRWRDRALARRRRADVYLFNTPVMPFLRRPRKSVVVVLDFAYRSLPPRSAADVWRKYLLTAVHGYAMRAAGAVIAISDATRRDAVRLFGIPEDKIRTVYLGYRRLCDAPEAYCEAPDKFFLFVGVMKERKNVRAIVRAFDKFSATHPSHYLLLAGRGDGEYGALVRRDAEGSSAAGRIWFLGYRPDAELAFLYRRAIALVYPSRIEGFGFPILEAMQCGSAVITSYASSLPELAGDAALLVDPDNVADIAGAMVRLADDAALRADLAARGRERAEQFSWERCAREVLAVLRGL
jgi:glycosyltransferase involved in cell wall biosynthesis